MPTSTHFNSDPFAGPTDFDIWEKPSSQCTPQVARPGISNHKKGLVIDFSYNGIKMGPVIQVSAGSPRMPTASISTICQASRGIGPGMAIKQNVSESIETIRRAILVKKRGLPLADSRGVVG